MSLSARSIPGAPAWGFVITLLGLIILLIAPILALNRAERYQEQIENEDEPAHYQINEALRIAHKAQAYAFNYYFMFQDTPHAPYATPEAYYTALQSDWRKDTTDDHHLAYCGPTALKAWRAGKAEITEWMNRYGQQYEAMGTRELAEANGLFERGIADLQTARLEAENRQNYLRIKIVAISRDAALIAVPMALICLLLAGLAWYNFRDLTRSWARERGTAERLEVAVKESNHRIKNNLQVIGALVDLQIQEPGDSVPKQALEELVRQVRAVAAVHDFLSRELRSELVQGDLLLERLISLTAVPAGLEVEVETKSVPLAVKQATAVALITNEVLLNAGKHGATRAHVSMAVIDEAVHLCVSDNGPGFPPGFDPARDGNLGLALIATLTHHDLSGDVTFANHDGAVVEVTFPLYT